jgi:hypothetical protein
MKYIFARLHHYKLHTSKRRLQSTRNNKIS